MKATMFPVIPDYHYRFDRLPVAELSTFEPVTTCITCGEPMDAIVIARLGGRTEADGLGVYSALQYLDVWNTLAVPDRRKFTGSQNWHRDPEDLRVVKVFLYLSDVDEGAGPMHYVPNSRQGERFGHLWPQRFPDGSYPPAEEFERRIPRSEWVTCMHPAGTMVFADTVGFHMGGRATERNRVLATWCYATPGSVWGRGFKTDPPGANDGLSPAACAALE